MDEIDDSWSQWTPHLPSAVVTPHGVTILTPDGVFETLDYDAGRDQLLKTPHLLISRGWIATKLQLRDIRAYDLLELFAFVRPTRFCLPTMAGLAQALTWAGPLEGDEDQCLALHNLAGRLLSDLGSQTYRYAAGGLRLASSMAEAGWPWGPLVTEALSARGERREEDGLRPWAYMKEWEDQGPPEKPGEEPVSATDAEERLKSLVGQNAEDRSGQRQYAATASYAFSSPDFEDAPNLQILEAGTGTGKTLGYIAPASVWAETNKAPVWLSTFTKNLQRQLDQELNRLHPDPKEKAKKIVVRKGRENYACLLNIEETMRAVGARSRPHPGDEDKDLTLLGLILRWARFTRSGDLVGGDFPSWLGTNFSQSKIYGLADRRGECLHAGCAHYRKCYIEKIARHARRADLVVANHALVMSRAIQRYGDPDLPKRIVFDEGHHVFEAADASFALLLSGLEGAELRRWLRGKESGGTTRARGLKARLDELLDDDDQARPMVAEIREVAHMLPGEGWLARITGNTPASLFERFLTAVRSHVLKRNKGDGAYGIEATPIDCDTDIRESARDLADRFKDLSTPMIRLSQRLLAILEEQADILESSTRGRLEAAANSVRQRADMVRGWTQMLESLDPDQKPTEEFVDWFSIDRVRGRDRDIGFNRHFLDPTKPLSEYVLKPADGVIFTSATLRDRGLEVLEETQPEKNDLAWQSADLRVGAQHLPVAVRRFFVESPFDYASNARFLVVTDVNKSQPGQVAGAYASLFKASKGSSLGLFTAIQRLRDAYERLTPELDRMGITLLAQHIDPVDTPTLIDMFRHDLKSCLLGTDAVRDGVDVPGESLRLMVFDRVPWPRPTILHKARRQAFGGKAYDEMIARLKITQAFGRLIRRNKDRGVFIMLDGQTPSRLLAGLPDGVTPERVGLAEAVRIVGAFTNADN